MAGKKVEQKICYMDEKLILIVEFVRVIELYQLPFDLTNAVLLVRSDLALSSVSKKKREHVILCYLVVF